MKKVLRDMFTRAGMNSYRQRPSNFLLVRSEHAHATYPGLFFRPPGFSPHIGREERRAQGLDYTQRRIDPEGISPKMIIQ